MYRCNGFLLIFTVFFIRTYPQTILDTVQVYCLIYLNFKVGIRVFKH